MFEMMLMRGGFNPYMGKIGLYSLNYVSGPTTDELYLFGGVTEDELQNNGLWLWNGKTDTYTNLGLVPGTVQRSGAGSVGTVGGDIYCVNGDVIDIYRVGSKRWEKRVGGTYGSPYHFMSNGSVTYGGYIYFFGPSTSPEGITLKRYDHVNNTWSTEATYKTTTNGGGYNRGVIRGNLAYFFGGGTLEKSVVKYNFTTKVWTTLASPCAILARPALSLYSNAIIITPMDEPGQPLWSSDGKLIMSLDTTTDAFAQIAETNPPKLTAATVVVGNQLKAFGGQNKATGKPVATVQSITVGPPVDNFDDVPFETITTVTNGTWPVRNMYTYADMTTQRVWTFRGITIGPPAANSTTVGWYNPTTGAWTSRYNWASGMPGSATMAVLNGKVYIFNDVSVWTVDVTNGALVKLANPTGSTYATFFDAPAAVYGDKIYLMPTSNVGGVLVRQIFLYDPVANSRTLVFTSPQTTTNGNDVGVMVGDWFCTVGSDSSTSNNKSWMYNVVTGVYKETILRFSISGRPTVVTDGVTFIVIGDKETRNGKLIKVNPVTGYSYQVGKLNPVKRNGAAVYDPATGDVTFCVGENELIASASPTVIKFKYPLG